MKKIKANSERNAGSQYKFRSFRRCTSLEKDNGRNDKKWTDQHQYTKTKASVCLNFGGFGTCLIIEYINNI